MFSLPFFVWIDTQVRVPLSIMFIVAYKKEPFNTSKYVLAKLFRLMYRNGGW